ncbi:uncharacterized protein L201_006099 [Kwoniella dendrophila CBS 6074]|uniref:Uncharacterized protein n=1 Tax=Kwoniella dendrophila CBS 6074 TaxID=1295534 RepID=A0AAX4K236_9TREE
MHSTSFSSPESGPSTRRGRTTSPSPLNSRSSIESSGYSSDHDEQDSPVESESSIDCEEFSPESKNIELPSSSSTSHVHEPPKSSLPSLSPTHIQQKSEVKPLASRYPRIFNNNTSISSSTSSASSSSSRPNRIRGLSPLSSIRDTTQNTSCSSELPLSHQPRLPKAQPLARALFTRSLSDTPHAGILGGNKKKTSQKLIVPTKSFRTTFELGLSASELARRA